jgi:carboxylesterase
MNGNDTLPSLVLIHDLMSSPLEFGLMTQILGARGVRYHFLEIPGYTHGVERPALAWRQWLTAAAARLDERYAAGEPIVLAGLGTGAALAAALALESRRQDVRGLALLSPAFPAQSTARAPTHAIAASLGLDRWVAIRRSDPFGIKNPKTRKWVAREIEESGMSSAGPATLPLRAVRESERLHEHVQAELLRLTAPLLVLHAREDADASLAAVSALVEQLSGSARLIPLEHSYHMITLDNDRQRVAHELADFLGAPKREPLAPRPAAAAPPRRGMRSGMRTPAAAH